MSSALQCAGQCVLQCVLHELRCIKKSGRCWPGQVSRVKWVGVYVVVRCSVLQCVAVCCSVLHCDAVCCSVLQCVAVCCSVLQCVAV